MSYSCEDSALLARAERTEEILVLARRELHVASNRITELEAERDEARAEWQRAVTEGVAESMVLLDRIAELEAERDAALAVVREMVDAQNSPIHEYGFDLVAMARANDEARALLENDDG